MRILSGLLPGHVLQRTPRGASVTARGTCSAIGTVIACITAKGRTLKGWKAKPVGQSIAGDFSARLSGIPTGGPYVLTLRVGKERSDPTEFYVGDLWLMAGQSNIQGVGNMADAPKPHPLVRNFSMARCWELARDPLHHLPESPDVVHYSQDNGTHQQPREAAKAKRAALKGVGVGIFFGIDMHRRSGVPQGLIATGHGGTSMEQWDPAKRGLGGESLYGSMLASLRAVDQPLAGVLWYQGESEANPAGVAVYTQRMQQLVAAVRADLHQPRLPWLMVQIGRFVIEGSHRDWNGIQEQQRLLPRVIPHLDVVPAVDLELDDVIHISGKDYATLGRRLARIASRLVHGDRREQPGIQPLKAETIKSPASSLRVEVRFAHVVGGLRSNGLARGFVFVDRNHKPLDMVCKTALDGDRAILELWGTPDLSDLRVMYGWGLNPHCTITDTSGMAVPVFGPMRLANQPHLSPWFATWDISGIFPGEDIDKLPKPTAKSVGKVERQTFSANNRGIFVNQHEQWLNKTGHAAFFTEMSVSENMDAQLRLGYDGPFRLWLDDQEIHRDLGGTNPATIDSHCVPLRLRKGRHRLTVLMALNRGLAWGFFLRFARLNTQKIIHGDDVALPVPVP